jgi:spore coat protein CotH
VRYFHSAMILLASLYSMAQVNFTSSNLPIITINTNGQSISDEPKITADMGIIYNGAGEINRMMDPKNNYNGKVGIELRGSTSQSFPKKPYGFETRDNTGEDLDVSLLGMPKESDWTLNATYNDKSLMRDGLAYILAGSVMEYAPRVRYCELVLNNSYMGIYLLIEKIKRDKSRVDISKMEVTDNSGDALTGGYIIKLDKTTGSNSRSGWFSRYKPFTGALKNTYFQYEYPSVDNITDAQKNYIQNHIHNVEDVIASNDYKNIISGYRKYIDVNSLMDFIIINELTKNPDGYRLSTFFYKERDSDGGKLKLGPVWDFNLGFGNVDYCTQGNPEGLVIQDFNKVCPNDGWVIHFWWKKFLDDPDFYDSLKRRWQHLRKNQFSLEKINQKVDSISSLLAGPQVRNFTKWPVMGKYVWPNYYIGKSYNEEVNWLKWWIANRINYLDNVWYINVNNTDEQSTGELTIFPNPASETISITMEEETSEAPKAHLTDCLGRIYTFSFIAGNQNNFEADVSHLSPGLYIVNIQTDKKTYVKKVLKL